MRVLPAVVCACLLTGCAGGGGADVAVDPQGTSLGTPVELTSRAVPGASVRVQAVRVLDPATPADGAAPAGTRWVAVDMRVGSAGTASYALPGTATTLVDADGRRHEAARAAVTAGPPLVVDQTLAPGSTAEGWVVFAVPSGTALDAVQYGVDSGSAPTVAWGL